MGGYLNFDRQNDGQSSLEEFCSCLERAHQSDLAWKYAMVSIHSALQAYMCIAIRDGNAIRTWKSQQAKKWLAAYREDEELPIPQLDFFMEIFDKTFSSYSEEGRESIKWLNDTRNGLVHFNTDSYSICRESIKECCREALQAIARTPAVAASGSVFFYTEEQQQKFSELCQKAEELLKRHCANA